MTTTYGTLDVQAAAFPVAARRERLAVATDSEFGQVVARATNASYSRQSSRPEIRSWDVTLANLSQVERDLVLAAYDAAKGKALPILWEPPAPDDGAEIPVRFAAWPKERRFAGPKYEMALTLEEVI